MATPTVEMDVKDIEVGRAMFRLMRRPGSAFVGMLRMDRIAGGELFGYAARLDSEDPVFRYFPRFAGWHGNADQLDAILRCVIVFHREHATAEVRRGDRR